MTESTSKRIPTASTQTLRACMPIMMDVVFNPWHVTPGNLQFVMLGLQHRRHLLEASLAEWLR